jgi:hypothetical protein
MLSLEMKMETVVNISDALDVETNEGQGEHKVILLPVQNRHSSSTRHPVSAERIAQLLQEGGYKGSIIETETRKYVESGAEGWKFRIYFFHDGVSENSEGATSLMFNSGWGMDPGDAEITLKAANIFNMKFRYLKAYVVSEENYTYTEAEMSQFCPDGLSDDEFNSQLEMFINLRQSYVAVCRELRK